MDGPFHQRSGKRIWLPAVSRVRKSSSALCERKIALSFTSSQRQLRKVLVSQPLCGKENKSLGWMVNTAPKRNINRLTPPATPDPERFWGFWGKFPSEYVHHQFGFNSVWAVHLSTSDGLCMCVGGRRVKALVMTRCSLICCNSKGCSSMFPIYIPLPLTPLEDSGFLEIKVTL